MARVFKYKTYTSNLITFHIDFKIETTRFSEAGGACGLSRKNGEHVNMLETDANIELRGTVHGKIIPHLPFKIVFPK